jgi:hypothetical protein
MPRFFQSPADAPVQEDIPYPAQPLTQDELLDDALRRILYVAHVTKWPIVELLSNAVKDWYDCQGECLMMTPKYWKGTKAQRTVSRKDRTAEMKTRAKKNARARELRALKKTG